MKNNVIEAIVKARSELQARIVAAHPTTEEEKDRLHKLVLRFDQLGRLLDEAILKTVRPTPEVIQSIESLEDVNQELKKASDNIKEINTAIEVVDKFILVVIKLISLV